MSDIMLLRHAKRHLEIVIDLLSKNELINCMTDNYAEFTLSELSSLIKSIEDYNEARQGVTDYVY